MKTEKTRRRKISQRGKRVGINLSQKETITGKENLHYLWKQTEQEVETAVPENYAKSLQNMGWAEMGERSGTHQCRGHR